MKITKAQRSFLMMLASLFATAVVFSIISLFVSQSSPAQVGMADMRLHGWPMAYYQAGCWEAGEACYNFTNTDWSLATANILAWFGFSALVWSLYYISRLKTPRRK